MFKNFFHNNNSNLISDLTIVTYGFQECEPLHSFGPAIRDYYLLHFVYEGAGVFKNPEGTYNLNSGDLFLIHPDELTYYYADKDNPWKYQWVGFKGINAGYYLSDISFTRSSPVVSISDIPKLKSIFEILMSINPSDEYSNLGTSGILSLILHFLLKEKKASLNNRKISASSYISKSLSHFEQNYPYSISLNALGKSMGLERTTFFRIFKRETGLSPKEYLIRFRLTKACELLSKTDLSISEIARSVGMLNSAHFATIFKNRMGKTPREYRK
jgi:AraC-like DNA-binding protein